MELSVMIIATDMRLMGGLVSVARGLGGSVEAIVIGDEELAKAWSQSGVEKVVHLETADGTPPEAYASQAAKPVAASGTRFVISNDNPSARMILGACAKTVDAAVVGNVTNVFADGDALVAKRSIANGRAIESVRAKGSLAAIFIGEDVEVEQGAAPVEALAVDAPSARIVDFAEDASNGLDGARRIVGIGMGLGSKANIPVAQELADALGAEIACTLPCCNDMKWFGPERVIGSSHSSVNPELYIALGISGSPNHMSGARDAKCVVAVNNDPKAMVFERCNYGIVGDVLEVAPALAGALK